MDYELQILSKVAVSPNVSQRELAADTGLSLGSINILVKKMAREGLIKLEKLPAERVAYMLTPMGVEEKISKTRSYINGHYTALQEMRSQLTQLFIGLQGEQRQVHMQIDQEELLELCLQVSKSIGMNLLVRWEGSVDTVILCDSSEGKNKYPRNSVINLHDYLRV